MKIGFRDVLFWLFLVLTIVLLLWYMFGDSPTEIFISSGIAGIIFVKMWSFNDRLTNVEMGTKNGFALMKKDIGFMKNDMILLKKDISLLKSDMGLVREDLSFIRGRFKK